MEKNDNTADQHIENTYILQPSLIVGDREENRFGEKMATIFMKTFGFLIPKKYKMIKAETIAEAMLALAKKGYSEKIITSEKLQNIGS